MPRRDGFPTNRELQVDFTSDARDIFVAACERKLESKISLNPAFEEKPLDHLFVAFARRYKVESDALSEIHYETLKIAPLAVETANWLEQGPYGAGNELFRGADDSVIDFYKRTAQSIASTAITDSFRFSQLTPASIDADWSAARDPNGNKNYHAGTFKQRPSKKSLILATFFANDVKEYVGSADFDKQVEVRMIDRICGFRDTDPRYDIYHNVGLEITPDLPLNGHESRQFIEAYANQMAERVKVQENHIEKLQNLGVPDIILDNSKNRLDRFKKAEAAAKRFL